MLCCSGNDAATSQARAGAVRSRLFILSMCLHVLFSDYPHGVTLVTPVSGSDKKQVLHFCALGSEEMQKFVEDLKESIAEVMELEQIRIECKASSVIQTPCSHTVCMSMCVGGLKIPSVGVHVGICM